MKLSVICFTKPGILLGDNVRTRLSESGKEVSVYAKMKQQPGAPEDFVRYIAGELSGWVEDTFCSADAILFIGASGIAVRSIAPFLRDKFTDPAVLVMDEGGVHCISLLSGHVGGANRLCIEVAQAVGAIPVITTATDIRHKFAVDVFAVKNCLSILDRQIAKDVSAAVLAGRVIPLFCEKPLRDQDISPDSLREQGIWLLTNSSGKFWGKENFSEVDFSLGIYIGIHAHQSPFTKTLYLVPKAAALGIGCRAGSRMEDVEALFYQAFDKAGIFPEAAQTAASIDLKKEEPGLRAFCEKYALPFLTYSAKELGEAEGEFHGSSFVEQTTGVDNVCERSACLAAGAGYKQLIIEKQAQNGVTFAAAERDWSIKYE